MSKRIFCAVLVICFLIGATLSVYSKSYEDEEGRYTLDDLQIFVPVECINDIKSVTEDIEKLDYVTETFIMTDLNDEDVFSQEYIHIIVYLDVQNESEFNSVMNELSEKEYVYLVGKEYLLIQSNSLCGDIDSDGHVTCKDAREILRIASGMSVAENEYQKSIADVDGDGEITTVDARIVLQMSLGIIETKSVNSSNEA